MSDCAICLCASAGDDPVRWLKCGHIFHARCIDPWKQSHNTCPLCRRTLSDDDDGFETLAEEINSMSGFHIFYHYTQGVSFSSDMCDRLRIIRNHLIEYQAIRRKGYSADHLATHIGYLVSDMNIELRALRKIT